MNIEERVSAVSNRNTSYLIVDTLPSGFRLYDFKRVLVRGLYFNELLDISRLKQFELNQVVLLYNDIIIPESEDTSLSQFELIDLLYLIGLSSIFTLDKFGWSIQMDCPHCSNLIKTDITLTDLQVNVTTFNKFPIEIPLKTDTNIGRELGKLDLTPLTIDKLLYVDNYKGDYKKEVLELALLFVPTMDDLAVRRYCEEIKLLDFPTVTLIKSILKEVLPSYPVYRVACRNCGEVVSKTFEINARDVIPEMELSKLLEMKYVWTRSFNTSIDTTELYKDVVEILELHNKALEKIKR